MTKINIYPHPETRIIEAMIHIYCVGNNHKHSDDRLCSDCRQLLEYASARLANCPFEIDKPNCSKCIPLRVVKVRSEKYKSLFKNILPRTKWELSIVISIIFTVISRKCDKKYRKLCGIQVRE